LPLPWHLPPPKLLLSEGGSAREDNKNWRGSVLLEVIWADFYCPHQQQQ
jgi:hypothetical protein